MSATFFEALHLLCSQDLVEEAIDLIFEKVDAEIDAGRLGSIELLLHEADLDVVPLAVVMGFLSATTTVKKYLSGRSEFWQRAFLRFMQECSEEDAYQLLRPFR